MPLYKSTQYLDMAQTQLEGVRQLL